MPCSKCQPQQTLKLLVFDPTRPKNRSQVEGPPTPTHPHQVCEEVMSAFALKGRHRQKRTLARVDLW
jgi:hypothetical protein